MTNSNSEANEALLTLIGMAQEEISDALTELVDAESAELQQLCCAQLENLVWATTRAGQEDLYLIVDTMQAQLSEESGTMGAERGAQILEWLNQAEMYVEAGGHADNPDLLLAPLSQESRDGLRSILFAVDDAKKPVSAKESESDAVAWSDSAIAEASGNESAEVVPELEDAFSEAVPEFEDAFGEIDDSEFDADDVLGMLAFELKEVSPELKQLAQLIVDSGDHAALCSAVDNYNEIVSRVASVADELGLQGLNYICKFVSFNLTQVAEKPPQERAVSLAVLQSWPLVVIEHLAHPDDDALCIAVIDYLEMSEWPDPVPYRDVRVLIKGLTEALEVNHDFEVELREIEATAEDVALEMSSDASEELIEAFFAESPAHAEAFSALMEAISHGENIQENVEVAQRIAHTLKGSGNMIGVKGIANLAHHIEDIFEYIAKHKITPPDALARTMQEAADTIEIMLESLQGLVAPPLDAQRVLQDVLDWANRIDSGKMRGLDFGDASHGTKERPFSKQVPKAADELVAERQNSTEAEPGVPTAGAEVVRVPLKLLDNIFRIVSETAITSAQIQERLNRLEGSEKMIRNNDGAMQQQRFELENLVSVRGMAARHRGSMADVSSEFDPLEMDEYDEFYGATHAYIEVVSDSREILRGFTGEVYELNALFLEHQRLNKDLQQMVMSTRMVQVNNIVSRLQRTVRQVCRATGKQADLDFFGQDLLLDGDVLNKLADPLMHMLRNAVDHGIESPEMRAANGKPAAGKITLSFKQEGNNVVVTCCDDGRGLNYERIREVAAKQGLIADKEMLDDQSLARMILQPGFSTSEQVTHVSGRGVGMDVVHSTIQSLSGAMEIDNAPDSSGTMVTLRLPITLLTSHCLLAGVGKETIYAIPTISLMQILSPGTGQISVESDKITYQLDQDVYEAYTLNSLIGAADQIDIDIIEKSSVLLVQTADGISAVIVERVVTSYDLVVKNMGAYIKSIGGIAGVSMLGNGEVVPVLDLAAMVLTQSNLNTRFNPNQTAATTASEVELLRVLIVDDSLSVRNSLSQLMRDSGYQSILARDGLEAINLLESECPDVVLTDLEMPRMNGLDLLSFIRNSKQWENLPVVMITSRSMTKHRQQAEKAGVNRYITKPFTDDEVLESIDEQLALIA
ncbi:MAG: response regulator [Gammaproteobacteria bacterium]|nr:response regulator [Gammaproteobacteria bacterium]